MCKKRDVRRIAGDGAEMLDNPRRPLADCVLKLAATVVSVDAPAQPVAGSQVAGSGRTSRIALARGLRYTR
jgi:hypothetical protein